MLTKEQHLMLTDKSWGIWIVKKIKIKKNPKECFESTLFHCLETLFKRMLYPPFRLIFITCGPNVSVTAKSCQSQFVPHIFLNVPKPLFWYENHLYRETHFLILLVTKVGFLWRYDHSLIKPQKPVRQVELFAYELIIHALDIVD